MLRHQKASQGATGLTRRPSSLVKVGCMALTFRMHGICSRVTFGAPSILVSSTRRLPKQSLVFWGISIFPWLGTLYYKVTFLVTVKIGEMTQVLASRTGYVGQRWSPPAWFYPDLSWRLFWKNRLRSGFFGALFASTSMGWGCSRWEPNCKLSLLRIFLLQIVSMKAFKPLRLLWRKALNSTQGKGVLSV